MAQSAIPVLSQYLRPLHARQANPSTDHELLQRFVNHRDESAFAVLVERHAALVLGLCRSILRNLHDAEDIFQATFLVLARKAASIRKGQSLGSWLYAVAYRLAHKVRARADKQRRCEQQAANPAEQTLMDAVTWGELRGILHEEVDRLPEKYRAAVVLCYWRGRTHEQAGQQLGWARATIKDRLEKARELLRKRLARRGLALSAAWLAAALSEGKATAVSAKLVQTTVHCAVLFSLGQIPAGVISANAVASAKSALQTMLLGKLKYGLALMLIFGILSGGAGLAILHESATPEEAKKGREGHDRKEDPLPAGAVKRLGTLSFRHSDRVRCIALGADGESVVSAAGNFVHVWDLATGKERRRFVGHEDEVNAIACSRDGKRIASLSVDGKIYLWDAATGKELRRFAAHEPNHNLVWRSWQMWGLSGLAFTSDGDQLVSRGSDNMIRLWNAATGKRKREFNTFSLLEFTRSTALGFTLSPDSKLLAVLEGKVDFPHLQLWDVAKGRIINEPAPKGCVWGAAFSPDGKTLAVGVSSAPRGPCNLELWDVASAKKIRDFPVPEGEKPLTFSRDGKSLVTMWWNGARLRDVQTGKILSRLRLEHPPTPIVQLLFGGDGKTLVSFAHGEHSLRLWDRASGEELLPSGGAVSSVRCAFAPNGQFLAVGAENGILRLWDVAANKEMWRNDQPPLLSGILVSPDSRLLLTNSPLDPIVRIREVSSGKEVRRINKANAYITSMAWSADGKLLATWPLRGAGQECFVQLWDMATGKEVHRLSAGNAPIN